MLYDQYLLTEVTAGRYLWVPKTCVTWAGALQIAIGPDPRSGVGRAGLVFPEVR